MSLKPFVIILFVLKAQASIELTKNQQVDSAEVFKQRRGGWSSGGGNVIVCFNKNIRNVITNSEDLKDKHASISSEHLNDITSVEMFDLYTSKLPRGLEMEVPSILPLKDTESIESYSKKVSKRFRNYFVVPSKVINFGINDIKNHNIRFHRSSVLQHKDMENIGTALDNNCMFTTIAVQRDFNGQSELHIDQRLFNHFTHSRLSKAVLLLHEYVYSFARNKGNQVTSYSTRKLVETMISKYHGQNFELIMNKFSHLKFTSSFFNEEDYLFNNHEFQLLGTAIGDSMRLHGFFLIWKLNKFLRENDRMSEDFKPKLVQFLQEYGRTWRTNLDREVSQIFINSSSAYYLDIFQELMEETLVNNTIQLVLDGEIIRSSDQKIFLLDEVLSSKDRYGHLLWAGWRGSSWMGFGEFEVPLID